MSHFETGWDDAFWGGLWLLTSCQLDIDFNTPDNIQNWSERWKKQPLNQVFFSEIDHRKRLQPQAHHHKAFEAKKAHKHKQSPFCFGFLIFWNYWRQNIFIFPYKYLFHFTQKSISWCTIIFSPWLCHHISYNYLQLV